MAQLVREVMTAEPVTMPSDTPVRDAAREMRDNDIGDVLVVDNGELRGIATDRDIVVRALADRDDLSTVRIGEVCSERLVTATPNEDVDNAIARMREHAVRRVPVVEDGRPVGIFSIGDAAMEKDPRSALGDISAAAGNR
ncbi:putative signal-transduction protein containing cAMP-binding and CBS domains [Saccharomonospora marina XMU15]|uniref:Putative signal-transduction protein containing cAMP-binding and CBS domains n=1 Tax=Saccharomonospora marina XMU15 TaxID=882083 RepID=H5WWE5_9PSEU|nr:CBS domain-containing protein [Saccharomonospora marina]EHR49429.1 putative signal-transduction protein containing cAMP-binding and CBS domains [Saccharomonospora marina XMU15]